MNDVKSLEELKAEVLKLLGETQKAALSALDKMPKAGSSARELEWKTYSRLTNLEAALREAVERLSS